MRTVSFIRLFSHLLKFYELNGFHHPVWTRHRQIKFSILTMHLVLLTYFTQSGVRFVLTVYQISKYIRDLNFFSFVFFYGAVISTYWMIIIESFSRKAAQEIFWNIVGDFNESKEWRTFERTYIFKFGAHLIRFMISFLFATQHNNTIARLNYYVPVFICANRLFYYLLCINIIKFELQKISNVLNSCLIYNEQEKLCLEECMRPISTCL